MRPIQPVSVTSDLTKRKKVFYAYVDGLTHAQNLQHISILNSAPANKVTIERLVPINTILVGVTGVVVRFDVKKITAHSGGTAKTVENFDTADGVCPSGITVRSGATPVTEGTIIFPITMSNDEISTGTAASDNSIRSTFNQFLAHTDVGKFTLRPGEGITVKQITNSTVGQTAWLLVFSVEPV